MKYLRVPIRLTLLCGLFLFSGLHFVFLIWLTGRAKSFPVRARWLQFWSRVFMRIINGRVTWTGTPPTGGLLVSNHMSYADIIVYGSICPLVLVSKSEVMSWPVIGPLTRCGGTLYIRRQSKSDVVRVGTEMAEIVNAGVVVALFLEGTTTTGESVLPFRSSLLAPAEEYGWPVCPARIYYTLTDGSVAEEICYIGDQTFFPHSLNMMSKRGFDAFVSFGEPVTAKLDRKEMARELHTRVSSLKDTRYTTAPAAVSAAQVGV